jgi:hypothetical protein
MTRPKISKFMAELLLQRSCGGRKPVVMGRFKYKFCGGKIYRTENVGYWGRLWERVEVDE